MNYTYSTGHPHAATSAGGSYTYDANGNMDTRTVGGQSYTFAYNAEGHLTGVTGSATATFVYDGDGKRVKSTIASVDTIFVGSHYEKTGTTITKYYYAGTTRIAMRTGSTLTYLLGDHLGSTSIVTNSSGALLMETRYKPFGEVRYATTGQTLLTKYTFTGQYSYVSDEATDAAGFGLMYFNARWQDPALGRFAQADSIIPGAGNPQAWDRYAFVNNNPVRYTDPTGHRCAPEDDCAGWHNYDAKPVLIRMIKRDFGITASDDGAKAWTSENLILMYGSLHNIDVALNGKLKSMVDGATIWMKKQGSGGEYHGSTHLDGRGIDFYTRGNDPIRQMNIYHEVGHLLDNVPGYKDVFTKAMENLDNPSFVDGPNGGIVAKALLSETIYTDPNYPRVDARQTYTGEGPSEQWADAFANYVAGNINLATSQGAKMSTFVTGALAPYIGTP